MDTLKIGCIVMAAGNAQRFGSNKLLAEVDGQPLIARALQAVPEEKLSCVRVVTQYPAVSAIAAKHGFSVVENTHPELGLSQTIALGLQALPSVDAALFMVADQPYLQQESVARLIDFYLQEPAFIAAIGHNGVHGNPCLFPARFFPELEALQGDRGGAVVIRKHPEALRVLEVDTLQLQDVDTPQQLETLA